PGYLAWYVRALLARGEAAQAESWLEQLVRLEPDSARTAELRAGWLVARGKYDEAIALAEGLLASEATEVEPADLDPAAETPGKAVRRVTAGAVATLLERLAETVKAAESREPTAEQMAGKAKLLAAAEQRYRQQAAADPNGFMLLAGFLARQDRIDEALELCEPGWHAQTAEPVALLAVGMLRSATADAPHVARVEAKLRELVEQKPESLALLEALANLYDLKGDYARAQQTYRRIIALDPKHMVALNNLALLRSYSGHGVQESLALITRAIAAAGPRPVLLDSRASIHLARRRPREAIEDLNEALADGPTAAMYFHLAQAHQMAGNRAEAAAALKQARQQGFEPSQLHPLEVEGYEKLAKELAGR
ncbi:MAG: tetratricopeptide repeat protein, partial [Pirellulales bacterium]